ncbi:hypothetical protein, partial [Treponema socranskii]|uniref:hypothetical protein n=1 Tax=Treponema socranskii TaxID=53419 RepID=UPI0028EDD5FD
FFTKKFACHRSERLGGIATASRSAFFILSYLFSVYTFFMRNPWTYARIARIAFAAEINF